MKSCRSSVPFPLVAILLLVALPISRLAAAEAWPEIVAQVQLKTIDGTPVALPADQVAVFAFLGTECPLAKLYGPRLQALSAEFPTVRFVGVFSNLQDSAADIEAYAETNGLRFPLCKDRDNVIADRFKASRTPEVFLFDAEHNLRYRGRIDDQYVPGASRAKPTRHDLRDAIQAVLAGREVDRPETEAVGCLIGRVKQPVGESDVTYCRQVARVLQQHCVECHRPSQIGPFDLTTYDEAIGWGDMMVEVINDGRMPPWHADPKHGEFSNARHMPEADKQILRDWVAAGMPYGDDRELPAPRQFVEGWRLPRKPDLVLSMSKRPFVVPAEGTVEYQYFVVDPGFKEDKWVTAAEVMPGNRGVVHHSIVFIRPPDGEQFRGVSWLSAYVPGQANPSYVPTRARFVPAGSKLVFQQHYTPNGSEQSDLTKIGILFGDPEKITHEVYTLIGIDQEFVIPPQADDFHVRSRLRWFPRDAELLAVSPHMHLRGKSFRLFAQKKSGTETLLNVPRYDFNWQHVYEFKTPIRLAEIDTIEFDVAYDNSPQNIVNPDPNAHVCWGDQTWEEMAVAFFEIAEPRHKSTDVTADSPDPQDARDAEQTSEEADSEETATAESVSSVDTSTGRLSPDQRSRVKDYVGRFFAKFDKNGDDRVVLSETPFAFQKFTFHLYDLDNDGVISRTEAVAAAAERIR